MLTLHTFHINLEPFTLHNLSLFPLTLRLYKNLPCFHSTMLHSLSFPFFISYKLNVPVNSKNTPSARPHVGKSVVFLKPCALKANSTTTGMYEFTIDFPCWCISIRRKIRFISSFTRHTCKWAKCAIAWNKTKHNKSLKKKKKKRENITQMLISGTWSIVAWAFGP